MKNIHKVSIIIRNRILLYHKIRDKTILNCTVQNEEVYNILKNNDSQCCEFVKIIKTAVFEKPTLETAKMLGK